MSIPEIAFFKRQTQIGTAKIGMVAYDAKSKHALGDGEDFELILAVPPRDAERLLRDQPVEGITLVKVGECIDSGLWIEEAGTRRPLSPAGWVHELR